MKGAAALALLLLSASAALCLFAPIPARADDAVNAAATAFYSLAAGKGFSSIGIPDAPARARLAPLLSPHLNQTLAEAAAAQNRFTAKHKDSPPLIEGDIFSSLFEGPTSWKLGVCRGDDKAARCAVSLMRQDPGQKLVSWTDTLILSNINGGWKVEDLAYDANFAFGNTGTLSEMLAMTKAEAP